MNVNYKLSTKHLCLLSFLNLTHLCEAGGFVLFCFVFTHFTDEETDV